ncbi:acyl-CoA dehydrogenase, long-chain specific [Renibacterium salmoninarum ATCC 33209]|uniref:Acyl-CoA dehydrogenase, long-chain specific n=1 Tax=Renibacterium salmoninarum (strain ATCC 33209 / DSM 20767 / JCM 11484 / NBRC 15589 / NCIMB 2235) TaxID=288705 RepID=A9WST6_RENSM|nr:acyl-CoA dehydrogenase family protein [Renibacterium salmoninarum]ABY23874.1 acyl-CoA dehydrogenase, long-chain specific [Renibacterium salmoninarum ATCC 33209]
MSLHRPSWMNEDLDALADLAREFYTKEAAPNEERWNEQQHVDRELWTKAGELGMHCLSIPEEYGGGGGDYRHEAVVVTEQMRALAPSFGASLHNVIVAHYLNAYGTEAQKQNWLPKMATAEYIGAIAMTEPGTGSDLQSVRTSAKLDGKEYVINGAKTFITNGFLSNFIVVVAKTTEEGGSGGISLIAVETDKVEGFRRGRNLRKIGQHGQDTCELFFDDVRVPAENLLGGEPNKGFIQLMQQLGQERLLIGTMAAANIEKSGQLAVQYAKERQAFGKPILSFQNTKFVLAECDTIASIAWAFHDECVAKHIVGELDVPTASKAKWWLTEQQNIVADRCLQIFGGYGYMEEYPIGRIFADARVQKIYGGTNEIMKELISRSL